MSSQPRRVWLLCSNRWNSAITEYALSSALALQKLGWESIFSPLASSPAALRARQSNLQLVTFEHFGLTEAGRFRRELKRIKPDLILLFGGPETFLSRLAPGIPKLRFRGQDADGHLPLSPLATRWSLHHCEGLITPSGFIQKRFAQVMGAKPVHCVPLGLERSLYQLERKNFPGSLRPVLRIFGRLDPVKGHIAFFELFQELLAQWPTGEPQPWLEVVGQEANLTGENLRQAASEIGLVEGRDWLLRLERVADVKALLSSTHLAIIPSLSSEIICRVAEEFLMAGCPLFVSGVGSLEECLFDSTAGMSYRGLSRSDQLAALRRWIPQSFGETFETREVRAARAVALFSLEQMGEQLAAAATHHL